MKIGSGVGIKSKNVFGIKFGALTKSNKALFINVIMIAKCIVNNDDNQFDIPGLNSGLKKIEIGADLKPLSRISVDLIGTKKSGHNRRDSGAMFD